MGKRITWLACILFITLNIFLIIKDDNEKVAHTSYIPKWTEIIEKDMYDKLNTTGVIDYSNKEYIYFNEEEGIFKEFLVDVGDNIFTGDILYSYEVEHYDEVKAQLDEEINRLENEIVALENAIRKIERHSVQDSTLELTIPNTDESIQFKQDNTSFALQKEQYIIEMEKELDQTEAQLDSMKEQLDNVTAQDKTIFVESPFAGKVTNKSLSLTNPILTIESTDLHIIGELAERERMDVETGMDVEVALMEETNNNMFEGKVSFVSEEPTNMSINKDSKYPFHVSFNEFDFDDPLQGYHVNLDIIIEESINALVTESNIVETLDESEIELDMEEDPDLEPSNDQLDTIDDLFIDEEDFEELDFEDEVDEQEDQLHDYIWIMDHNGKIVKQPIERGVEMDDYVELINNVHLDDRVAINSRNNLEDGATFITPFTPNKSTWDTILKDGSRKRSIVIGLLVR